jgi:hypothetical protein
MTASPNSSGLRDNYSRGNVGDFLREKIRDGSQLSVVSAYFTIYAYDALRTWLDRIDHLDFLALDEPKRQAQERLADLIMRTGKPGHA